MVIFENTLNNYVPVKDNRKESRMVINWTLAKHDIIEKEHGWLERSDAIPVGEAEKIEIKLRNT